MMKALLSGIKASLLRSVRQLTSSRTCMVMLTIVPLAGIFFFLSLLSPGVPKRVPTAVVDLDNTSMSRRIIRSLDAMESVAVDHYATSYSEAMALIHSGKIYGFFMIPNDFEQEALAGRRPTLTYYCDMTCFVPATFAYKGFKTVAVSASGSLVATTLVASGLDDAQAMALIRPVVINLNPIGNPWLNYSYYLCSSFLPALLGLFIVLMTVYTICDEISRGTSIVWLATAHDSMLVALIGKLLPQWVAFSSIGVFMQWLMYGYYDFPLNGSLRAMIAAMLLFVAACQAFALIIVCLIPNMRLSLSVTSLLGVLAFSLAGFSFPVADMYPAVGIFSHILPVRHFFLISSDIALNGYPVYFARFHYIALLLFLLLPLTLLWRLRRACLNPINIP